MKPIPYYAQGDVKIFVVDGIPKDAVRVKRADDGRFILAAGEATGHHHAVESDDIEMYELNGSYFIHVPISAVVDHEEHGEIPLTSGFYKSGVDYEYVPGELQRTRD